MIPVYVWVTLSIIGGIILLYFVCLKLSANDWIGNIPPGPIHIPFSGCFFHLLRISNLGEYCERLFLLFGNVVKFCIFRKTIILVRNPECLVEHLNVKKVKETTQLWMIKVIKSLGFDIPKSKDFVRSCFEMGKSVYNHKMSMDDFRILMEACENYQTAQQEKKVQHLIFAITKQKIDLDKNDSKSLEECTKEIEVIRSSIEDSPQIYLPLASLWPLFILKRKRVYKSVLKVQQKLQALFEKKFPDESDEDVFNLLFILYLCMSLSETRPKRCRSSKPQFNLDDNPDAIIPVGCHDYNFSFDVSGLRFFKAMDYIKVLNYDIPAQTLIISFAKE